MRPLMKCNSMVNMLQGRWVSVLHHTAKAAHLYWEKTLKPLSSCYIYSEMDSQRLIRPVHRDISNKEKTSWIFACWEKSHNQVLMSEKSTHQLSGGDALQWEHQKISALIYEAINRKPSDGSQEKIPIPKVFPEKRNWKLSGNVGINFQLDDNSTLERAEEGDGEQDACIFPQPCTFQINIVSQHIHFRSRGLIYWMCAQQTEKYWHVKLLTNAGFAPYVNTPSLWI